ncbi:serine hydrolase domain-containing protein [Nonomuraea turcica]|uniref:serine hydrolase domain-containing protein n=1 Tax=Nonomuraea sp. G32 TaxID=3067274 RepID=UPI00273CEBC7|nr:serine hydrolase domain-containing protein [Nonomuraea sp. G32]MDP4500942.1 serine hydrolase domain-containing protein [Nonomuraea sp. G32]
MTINLSDQDKSTLRIAAYGAVSLMAAAGAAGKPHKIATSGSIALGSATGLIGHVLADYPEGKDLTGKSVAEIADRVLPALTAAMNLLKQQDPAEADNFRSTVLVAVETAQMNQGRPSPATAEMARKITEALDDARVAAADSGAVPAAAAGQDRPELQKAIEEIVESGFLGVSLRVHDERGEWAGSAGVAELGGTAKPPVNGHARIGSNTKTFTATLVLQLVAEGKIELDTPAADYLPAFGLDRRITVRMLLQHTSGLFNFTGEVYDDGSIVHGIPVPYSTTGKEWVDNRFHTYRPEELVRLALSKPARFEPGTGWSYSNTNYVLARLLIEKVTGRSLAEEMQRLILGPLGLSGTVVPDASPEIPEPHAHIYYRYEEAGRQKTIDITRYNPSWVSTGGDMISTSQDLHTFISALVGGKLLPAALLAEMCTPHATGIPNMDYGLGVFVQKTDCGGTVITHNGGNVGSMTLMYSTPDGGKTLTAVLNWVDDADMSMATVVQNARQRLVNEVFCGEQADPAQPAD